MKTAVSIPNQLFRDADRLARKLRVSRSELYARALAEFLGERRQDAITEGLNAVYANRSSRVDAGLAAVQARSIKPEKW